MRTPTTGHRVRAVGLVAALALGTGLLAAVPAQAADTTVDDATFTWGLSGYAQKGIFGAWNYKDLTGNATVLTGSVSGGTQTEYLVDPVPVTSYPADLAALTPNAVRFTAGTGTVDADTGAGTLTWDGSYTVNAYPAAYNAPNEVYADPQLTVDADGAGTLSFDFTLGAGTDMSGNPIEETSYGRITVLTFSAGSISGLTEDGYRISPDYQGVTVTVADGTAQNTTCAASDTATGWWGSWAPEFVNTVPSSVRPHFYSTGCGGMQDYKPALPIDIGYTADVAEEPAPGDTTEVSIGVDIPETTVEPEPGAFGWSLASTGAVSLGTAVSTAAGFSAAGTLHTITVTDTRLAAPAWSLSGQVSDFTTSDGSASFGGQALGWTPTVSANTVDAVAGATVATGTETSTGLAVSSTLAYASTGHASGSVDVDAALALLAPATTAQGSYTATLTLTALS